MGLALESLVGIHYGGREMCNISEEGLKTLLEISNARFRANTERTIRFREVLRRLLSNNPGPKKNGDGGGWEDAQDRRNRKKAEGLSRKEFIRHSREVRDDI
jgi:tRNA wybutosine-synthesizing protein 3